MTDQPRTMTKGEFARRLGISPGRLSQLIAEGVIGGDALVGQGVRAEINPAVALQQLAEHDVNTKADLQALDGLEDGVGDDGGTIERQIKIERLAAARRANERAAVEDLTRAGELLAAGAVTAGWQASIRAVLAIFDGWPARLSQEVVAAVAGRPFTARDLHFVIGQSWKAVRAQACTVFDHQIAAMPETLTYNTETHCVVEADFESAETVSEPVETVSEPVIETTTTTSPPPKKGNDECPM